MSVTYLSSDACSFVEFSLGADWSVASSSTRQERSREAGVLNRPTRCQEGTPAPLGSFCPFKGFAGEYPRYMVLP